MSTNTLVAKIWSFCDTLRDDGVTYGDYIEQITYLLFLKMADEYEKNPSLSNYNIPQDYKWETFLEPNISTKELPFHYHGALTALAESGGGMLSKIYEKAQNKISDPTKLRKLIDLINSETWITDTTDIKGDIYEALLQKNAESSGAGQYFTPRAVIETIVACINPKPNETVADPSCGTGGFFLGVLNHIKSQYSLNVEEQDFLKFHTFKGWEIVPETARLCLMNLFLHGVGDLRETPEIKVTDSLKDNFEKVDIVLANPPFGKSSSDIPTIDEKQDKKDGYFLRKDFWATTSNKQLAFLQHIVSMLKVGGRAAVVLPDNVLFEGGAGEVIRKKLIEECNLHTILRLPTGIFYAQGVKSNVLFFDKTKSNPTKEIWIYDYRTNIHHTLKTKQLKIGHLAEFITLYNNKDLANRRENWNIENGRWRKYTIEEILTRDKTNLDIFWLKDESLIDLDNLPDAETLIDTIIENIESALVSFKTIKDNLE